MPETFIEWRTPDWIQDEKVSVSLELHTYQSALLAMVTETAYFRGIERYTDSGGASRWIKSIEELSLFEPWYQVVELSDLLKCENDVLEFAELISESIIYVMSSESGKTVSNDFFRCLNRPEKALEIACHFREFDCYRVCRPLHSVAAMMLATCSLGVKCILMRHFEY